MKRGAQTINIRARCSLGLCFRILFSGCVSWRDERNCIRGLPGFEVTRNAKIDQIKMPTGSSHYIGRLEVAEDNGREARVQVVKHGAYLYSNIKGLFKRKIATGSFTGVSFQGLAFDEIHHQVPASPLGKLFVDARQVGV